VLKLGILLIAIGFLVGCTTSKEDALIQSYQQKVDYHKQLQKTEKIQLFENNVTKAVLTATYLYTPNFKKHDQRDEQFIVGVHLEDETVIEREEIIEIIEIFGIRDTDDIKKMRDKQEKESKVVPNSLYDDMMSLIDTNNTLKTTNKKKTKKTKKTTNKKTKNKVKKYGLMLQGKNAIQIKALSKNDERLKDIAYVTDWGSYYLVTFEHTNSKRFSLVFESEKYGKGTFSFAKVAKYIYTKKGF
jgi:hypothetical protein